MARSLTVGSFIHSGKYKIYRLLGNGTFGEVFEAAVMPEGAQYVAIKVATAERHNEAARRELLTLQKLQTYDSGLTVKVFDSFEIQMGAEKRLCIVIEKLDYSLAHVLAKKRDGFSLPEVAVLGRQLLQVLSFFERLSLLHMDLKPGNILLSAADKRIRITDFGSAYFQDQQKSKVAQTPAYRAPEVSLELFPYTPAADMWSVGVILAELYISRFRTSSDDARRKESLPLFVRHFGLPPPHLLQRSHRLSHNEINELRVLAENSAESRIFNRLVEASRSKSARDSGLFPAFQDLLQHMLEIDPQLRINAEAALSHEFFQSTASLSPEDVDIEPSCTAPWPHHLLLTGKFIGRTRRETRRNSFIAKEQKKTAETTPPQSSSGGSGGRESGSSIDSEDKQRQRNKSAH